MRETGEKETELSATLLPVLVKCCVLLKRQPRMCQPSHLALPNGLLNADIKLTRSYALPFSFLSTLCSHYRSFSPCPSPCHSLVLSLSFTTFQLLCLSTSRSLSFPYIPHSLYPCRLHLHFPEPFQQVVFLMCLKSTFLQLLSLSFNRLHNAVYSHKPSFTLTLLHVLSAPLHGLANAFVFGMDRDWWNLLSPTGMQVWPTTHAFKYISSLTCTQKYHINQALL